MKRKKQKEEIKSDNGRATVGGGFNRRTPPPDEAFFGRAKSSFSISFFSFFLAVAKPTERKEGRERASQHRCSFFSPWVVGREGRLRGGGGKQNEMASMSFCTVNAVVFCGWHNGFCYPPFPLLNRR